jgi:hypothetical protein
MRHDQRHRPRGQHQPLGMRARRDRRLAPALPTLPPWPLWTSPWKPAPPPVATPTRGATSASSTPPSRSRRRTPVAKHSAQPARRRKDDQHVRNELERLACQLAHQFHPKATTCLDPRPQAWSAPPTPRSAAPHRDCRWSAESGWQRRPKCRNSSRRGRHRLGFLPSVTPVCPMAAESPTTGSGTGLPRQNRASTHLKTGPGHHPRRPASPPSAHTRWFGPGPREIA